MRKNREYINSLVRKCIKKDSNAWDKLAGAITPLMASIIRSTFFRLGFNYQNSDIENIIQDILLSIWEKNKLATITNTENAVPWICTLASHTTSNYIRAIKPFDRAKASPLSESLKSPCLDPPQEILNRKMQEDIERALNLLNVKENIIIKLYVLYNKSYKDISRILNMPIGTVLVYARRARIKLKGRLKKYEKKM